MLELKGVFPDVLELFDLCLDLDLDESLLDESLFDVVFDLGLDETLLWLLISLFLGLGLGRCFLKSTFLPFCSSVVSSSLDDSLLSAIILVYSNFAS